MKSKTTIPKLTRIKFPLKSDDKRLSESKHYLAKISGYWVTGHFSSCWYGWLFIYGATSAQVSYDRGKSMNSNWEALFEIK